MEVRATEIEWLRWFASNVDFGPADYDVQMRYQQQFEEETSKLVADGWRMKDDEDYTGDYV